MVDAASIQGENLPGMAGECKGPFGFIWERSTFFFLPRRKAGPLGSRKLKKSPSRLCRIQTRPCAHDATPGTPRSEDNGRSAHDIPPRKPDFGERERARKARAGNPEKQGIYRKYAIDWSRFFSQISEPRTSGLKSLAPGYGSSKYPPLSYPKAPFCLLLLAALCLCLNGQVSAQPIHVPQGVVPVHEESPSVVVYHEEVTPWTIGQHGGTLNIYEAKNPLWSGTNPLHISMYNAATANTTWFHIGATSASDYLVFVEHTFQVPHSGVYRAEVNYSIHRRIRDLHAAIVGMNKPFYDTTTNLTIGPVTINLAPRVVGTKSGEELRDEAVLNVLVSLLTSAVHLGSEIMTEAVLTIHEALGNTFYAPGSIEYSNPTIVTSEMFLDSNSLHTLRVRHSSELHAQSFALYGFQWVDCLLELRINSIKLIPQSTPPGSWIGTFYGNPNPAVQGQPLTLHAGNVVHPLGRDVISVNFYRDTNGNKIFDPGTDQHLGLGTKGSNGWSLTFEPNYPIGSYWFFARATDNLGNHGDAVTTTVTFTQPAAVPGSDLSLISFDWTDPRGDRDNVIEGWEEVRLDIRLRNNSNAMIHSAEARLVSNEIYLDIFDDEVTFYSFQPGESLWSRGSFEMQLYANSANNVGFSLRVTYEKNGIPYYQDFHFTKDFHEDGAYAAAFAIIGYEVDDSPSYRTANNGDGVFDSGERVRIRPRLRNTGNANATRVGMRLTWAGSGVEPYDNSQPYPDISAGASSLPSSNHFYAFQADRSFAGSVNLDFEIEWKESQAPFTSSAGFPLTVNGVGWLRSIWDSGALDASFGQVTPGMPVTREATITNQGSAPLTITSISTSHPDTTISNISLPAVIPPGQTIPLLIGFDTTGLNESVVRAITINSDGRYVDSSGLRNNVTLVLSGTVTDANPASFEILQTLHTGDSSNSSGLVAVKAADMLGDSLTELVVLDYDSPNTPGYDQPRLYIYGFNSSGIYEEIWNSGNAITGYISTEGRSPLTVGDINGDGKMDIVVAVYSMTQGGGYGTNGKLYFLERAGNNNSWSVTWEGYNNHGRLLDVLIADSDKDGRNEIILTTAVGSSSSISSRRGRLFVIENNGGTSFSQIYTIQDLPSGWPNEYIQGFSGLTVADSDGDGFNEIIFAAGHQDMGGGADSSGDQLYIYESTGNNSYQKRYSGLPYTSFGYRWDYAVIAVGDVDADGKAELLLADDDSRSLWIWEIGGNNSWSSDIAKDKYEYRLSGMGAREGWSLHVGNLDDDPAPEILYGTWRSGVQHNAFILEGFAKDSYRIEWSEYLASNEVNSADIISNTPTGTPWAVFGIKERGIFIAGPAPSVSIDLIASPGNISIPEPIIEGVPTTIDATILNSLSAAVESVRVRFFEGDPTTGGEQIASDVVLPSVPGEGQTSATVEWVPATEGAIQIFVVVDPNGDITETDKSNNVAPIQVIVEDSDVDGPVIAAIQVHEYSGDADGTIQDDEGIIISWTLEDASGISSSTLSIEGEEQVLTGEYWTVLGPLAPGLYAFEITATDADVSPESSTYSGQFRIHARVFTLNFQTDGTPGAILDGETTQTVPREANAQPVTAYASGGWEFAHWSRWPGGEVVGSETTLHATSVNQSALYVAHFVKLPAAAGDINGDGVLNVADVTLLANHLRGIGTLPNPQAANINGDGVVDQADLDALIELILGSAIGAGSPPIISIISPASNTTVPHGTTSHDFSGTAASIGGTVQLVEWRLNGGDWSPASGTTSWSFTASPLAVGANTIAVRARDAEGVNSSVATRIITREESSEPGGAGTDVLTILLPGDVPLTLIRIPAGSFVMGSPPNERSRWPREGPQTNVTLTNDFYMGKFEVTQGQWEAIMGTGNWPGAAPSSDTGIGSNYPAYNVSWHDTQDFIAALNAYLVSIGQSSLVFRLPTEAEWEYAARAGTSTRFSFGDSLIGPSGNDGCQDDGIRSQYMWFCGNANSQAHPVGQKLPNAFGLHDMHGNLSEWVQDWRANNLPGGSVIDPPGPLSGDVKITRGGNWFGDAIGARSACRLEGDPTSWNTQSGFRLVALVSGYEVGENLLQNGSFETPVGYRCCLTGNAIPGWSIGGAGVDQSPQWAVPDGAQSIDLNAGAAGTIQQTVATVPGTWYEVRYVHASNPSLDGPAVRSFEVSWGGKHLARHDFDPAGKTDTDMGWIEASHLVNATASSTVLRFASLSSSAYGPTLDHVQVRPVLLP